MTFLGDACSCRLQKVAACRSACRGDQSELLQLRHLRLTVRASIRKDLGLSETEKAAHLSACVASGWDLNASLGRRRSRRASARVSAFGFAAEWWPRARAAGFQEGQIPGKINKRESNVKKELFCFFSAAAQMSHVVLYHLHLRQKPPECLEVLLWVMVRWCTQIRLAD